MAKKNQVTEAKIASLKEEIEKLRNDNHNLKRKIKRMEERQSAEKAERQKAQTELSRRTEEVTKESMDDIKKKLLDAGLNETSSEVMTWAMFGGTDSKRK